MTNEFSDSLYWNDVSGETEHLSHQAALVHGKVAVAAYWPFLSGAVDEADYENRFEIVSNKIENLVAPEAFIEVVSSLRDDFRAVHEALQAEAAVHTPPHIQVTDRNDGLYITDHVFAPKQSERLYSGPDKDKALDYAHKTAHTTGHPVFINDDEVQDTQKTAYIDPDDKRRYDDYPNLNPPVDNGALQGPDGFVQDLAQGEHAGADEKWNLQLTPGQWHDTPGTAMPVRPMPQGVARGYQAEGAKHKEITSKGCPDCGAKWSDGKLKHDKDCKNLTDNDPFHEKNASSSWGHDTSNHGEFSFQDGLAFNAENYGTHTATKVEYFDQEVQQWKTALVDPAPGTTQHVNPFYFAQGTDGVGDNTSFPEDPWGGPLEDRANTYGDVAPQVSSGSDEGTVDGKGYSRSTPGESPNFNVSSAHNSPSPAATSWVTIKHPEAVAGYPGHGDPYKADCKDCGRLITHHDQDLVRAVGEDHNVMHQQKAHDDLYGQGNFESTFPHLFSKKQGSTNGRIVGNCPGCDEKIRQHDSSHGSEFRHLHNDSVRCNFQPEASLFNHHKDAMDDDEAHVVGKLLAIDKYKHDRNGKQNFVDGYTDAHSHARNGERPNHEVGVDMNLPDSYNDGYTHGWYHATGERTNAPSRTTAAMSGPGTDYPTWDSKEPEDSAGPGDGEGADGSPLEAAEAAGSSVAPELAALAGYNIERPTPENPTGRGDGDEYQANTFDSLIKQRPMQSAEDRGINTPVHGAEPIKTRNFNTPGGAGGTLEQSGRADDDDDEEED